MEPHVSDSVLILACAYAEWWRGMQYPKASGACSVNARLEVDGPRPIANVDSQRWQVGLVGRLMPPNAGLCEFSIEIAYAECFSFSRTAPKGQLWR
jgi:hypothetical protein